MLGGGAHFHRDNRCHALKVALVSVHDCHIFGDVQVLSQLLGKRLDCCLNEGLFSIDIETTVALLGDLGEVQDASSELIEVGEVTLGETAELLADLSHQGAAFSSIDVEEMSIGVTSNICHFVGIAALGQLLSELIKILSRVLVNAEFSEISGQLVLRQH